MSEAIPDFLDETLSITPGSWLDHLRRGCEEARRRTQTSFEALFAPAEFGDLTAEERYAVAVRVAEVSGATALASRYAALRDRHGLPADDGVRRAAILAHAAKVARAPGEATRGDLDPLAAAGLTPAAVVTLSQIVGFVAYQIRAASTLVLLRGNA